MILSDVHFRVFYFRKYFFLVNYSVCVNYPNLNTVKNYEFEIRLDQIHQCLNPDFLCNSFNPSLFTYLAKIQFWVVVHLAEFLMLFYCRLMALECPRLD